MKFRTELTCSQSAWQISHSDRLLFIGSCFSDEMGRRLAERGFDISVNPFGPLYNPLSIANCIHRSLSRQYYTLSDLTPGPRGYHCLDYAMRFSGEDADSVLDAVNSRLDDMRARIEAGAIVFITLGTVFVYFLAETWRPVGNCHKFPPSTFIRRRISIEEAREALHSVTTALYAAGASQVVFTVSPIRHLSDGFHENTLSKASLHMAVDMLGESVGYFPSYEIVMDDLRDYRAYADDMVHIAPKAVDYIYEKFEEVFFSTATRQEAAAARKRFLSSQHRQILNTNE